jgi:nicotinate-nucleotide pyrophosphorylase (carboxylating)
MTKIIRLALEEDIGVGDITSRACVPEDRRARGTFIAREPLILAGTEVISEIFDRSVLLKKDGDACRPGDIIATVELNARTLLERERVSLNFLQRLSGVATLARHFADAVAGTDCRVLDTRKTTPGMRALEKRAAAAGGVTNHRMGLYDAILIKNNHITAAGGVTAALQAALRTTLESAPTGAAETATWHGASLHSPQAANPLDAPAARPAGSLPVEIEVRTLAELHEALAAGATHLLLDNLTPAEAAAWVREIAGRATVELSGGITLETVRAYAETGADFVSAGAITHSARAVDISLRLEML